MKTNPYDKLLSRKRKWTPVKPKAGAFKNGAEEAIRRCLAIRHMELPVGEFIKEGLEKNQYLNIYFNDSVGKRELVQGLILSAILPREWS